MGRTLYRVHVEVAETWDVLVGAGSPSWAVRYAKDSVAKTHGLTHIDLKAEVVPRDAGLEGEVSAEDNSPR